MGIHQILLTIPSYPQWASTHSLQNLSQYNCLAKKLFSRINSFSGKQLSCHQHLLIKQFFVRIWCAIAPCLSGFEILQRGNVVKLWRSIEVELVAEVVTKLLLGAEPWQMPRLNLTTLQRVMA